MPVSYWRFPAVRYNSAVCPDSAQLVLRRGVLLCSSSMRCAVWRHATHCLQYATGNTQCVHFAIACWCYCNVGRWIAIAMQRSRYFDVTAWREAPQRDALLRRVSLDSSLVCLIQFARAPDFILAKLWRLVFYSLIDCCVWIRQLVQQVVNFWQIWMMRALFPFLHSCSSVFIHSCCLNTRVAVTTHELALTTAEMRKEHTSACVAFAMTWTLVAMHANTVHFTSAFVCGNTIYMPSSVCRSRKRPSASVARNYCNVSLSLSPSRSSMFLSTCSSQSNSFAEITCVALYITTGWAKLSNCTLRACELSTRCYSLRRFEKLVLSVSGFCAQVRGAPKVNSVRLTDSSTEHTVHIRSTQLYSRQYCSVE